MLLIGLAVWLARRRSQKCDIGAQPDADSPSQRQPDEADAAQPPALPVAPECARISAWFTSAPDRAPMRSPAAHHCRAF